ncbi:hypothetical protein QVD17_02179 [Tagetes erecta]|uniref:Protein LIKE COV 2 n=1 Tax=Tagetes erecta TaxID=13708 RepID=A0AAD8L646_TARER|nr:hypothetical protein QVD17_02179 [Tagetes erecta]
MSFNKNLKGAYSGIYKPVTSTGLKVAYSSLLSSRCTSFQLFVVVNKAFVDPIRSDQLCCIEMAEGSKESTSTTATLTHHDIIVEDTVNSPPNSPNSSTRKACYAVLQSWVSKKFMTGCVVLFPVAVTFFVTWWIVQFFDGFFSPIYERLGVEIFGLGFLTSLIFIFFVGIFASSWMGATVFWVGEWFIKRMPFVKHIYSASKQISAAISPDQNTTAFKEVAIIRHPRLGEYAIGFITSSVVLQRENEDEVLCSVYVPTNHLYIGDVFLVNSEEIIRPNLSIREGIEIIVSVGMSMPQLISPIERASPANDRVPLNRLL